jgi:hypothetical protein
MPDVRLLKSVEVLRSFAAAVAMFAILIGAQCAAACLLNCSSTPKHHSCHHSKAPAKPIVCAHSGFVAEKQIAVYAPAVELSPIEPSSTALMVATGTLAFQSASPPLRPVSVLRI